MKKYVYACASIFFLLAISGPVRAQQPFEGTVTWSLHLPSIDDESHPSIVSFKGERSEMDMDMGVQGNIKTYLDDAKKKVYIVVAALGRGMTSDLSPKDTGKSNLKATGKTQTIAGHTAQEFVLTGPKQDVTIWASPGFPPDLCQTVYRNMRDQPNNDSGVANAFREISSKGMLPIKIVVTQAGDTALTMEFVKFERKSLPDSLFVPPANINYQPIPAGMQGGE